MTVGIASSLVNDMLDTLNNSPTTAVATVYVQLHSGDPLAAGTNAAWSGEGRQAVTFGAASGGVLNSSNTPTWTGWSSGAGNITHISLWNAASAGTFLWSIDVADKAVADTDDVTLDSLQLSISPLAAA